MSDGAPNAGQSEYWNATAGPKWVEEQEHLDAQLGPLGRRMLERAGIRPGERVLDIGCGCGDLTLAIAQLTEPGGSVLGVDVSEPMLARARERAAALPNATFLRADAQTHPFAAGAADAAVSRFGVMFFADFAAAFANVRVALRPGGRLAFVCWQEIARNPWMLVPMQVAARLVALPPPAPPGSPGPFGLDDPDRIRRSLDAAGFSAVEIESVDAPQNVGGARTVAEAVAFQLTTGPAAAALRDAPREVRPALAAALAQALAPFATEHGVVLPGAAWIVTARA